MEVEIRSVFVFAVFGLLTVMALGFQSEASQGPAAPMSLVIEPVKPAIKTGKPVEIRVRLTNNLSYDLPASSSWEGGMDMSFAYHIENESGAAPAARAHEGPITDTSKMRVIKPGETIEEITHLSNGFDMSVPGKYTVSLSREVSTNSVTQTITSNKVVITVKP